MTELMFQMRVHVETQATLTVLGLNLNAWCAGTIMTDLLECGRPDLADEIKAKRVRATHGVGDWFFVTVWLEAERDDRLIETYDVLTKDGPDRSWRLISN